MKKIKKQNELLKMNFFLFNKKLIRNKIVRSQSKLHKIRILMTKDTYEMTVLIACLTLIKIYWENKSDWD